MRPGLRFHGLHAPPGTAWASELFLRACHQLGLDPNGLVLHSGNGGPMKNSTRLATLQWLGVVASFSRPRVSKDNPHAEAVFRTVK
jgi:putative transposase